MLTPFGKEIRKKRIDKEMTLAAFAELLEVSPTFVTAVETGKKPVPDEFIDKAALHLNLSMFEIQSLRRAAEQSKPAYKISVPSDTSNDGREVVALFAKKFSDLTASQVSQIKSILLNEKEDRLA